MQRRDFIRACAGSATLASIEPLAAAAATGEPRLYERARLVDEFGRPLRVDRIPARRNLLFHYPYVGTPAFLLELGEPARRGSELATEGGERYAWRGGVGPTRSLVAYSAICAHQLAYPTRDISFIAYRDAPSGASRKPRVIHCCAEHSQYDPADGGRVLSGPASQPLAAILLEHDAASGDLWAVGTQGGELFDKFFAKYDFRLATEYGGRARRPVGATCTVHPMENWCRQQIRC